RSPPLAPAPSNRCDSVRPSFRGRRIPGGSGMETAPPEPHVSAIPDPGMPAAPQGGESDGQGPRIERQERQAVRGASQEGHEQGARRQDLEYIRSLEEGRQEA